VVIKKTEAPIDLNTDYNRTIHYNNIVNLFNIFMIDITVYMINEQMDVTLRMINGIPRRFWKDYEIAAICKEARHSFHFL
jgi:hypothetical protein